MNPCVARDDPVRAPPSPLACQVHFEDKEEPYQDEEDLDEDEVHPRPARPGEPALGDAARRSCPARPASRAGAHRRARMG